MASKKYQELQDAICTKCGSKFQITGQTFYKRTKKGLPMYCDKCMKVFISELARERAKKRLESMTPEEYQKFLDQSNWRRNLTDEQKKAHTQRLRDKLASRTPEEWAEINKKNSEGLRRY